VQYPETDFLAVLTSLAKHEVEFIVVGGVAAVLQGAPVATFDLDVVHSRSPENVHKLLKALDDLGASYRTGASRELKPDVSHLSSSGHQLLMTRFGPLDLLGSIGKGHHYDELVNHATEVEAALALQIRVLSLSWVIKTKEETGHEKDAAVLAILRRTLEEREAER
jgi:hypothetical protein